MSCNKQWLLFREKVLQVKNPSKKIPIEGIVILTKVMMTFSASTASCERGFSAMNNEKTSL